MSEPRTIRSIGVAAQDRPALFEYVEQPPEDGQFRVDTLFTGLSAGTELTFVKGTNPYLHASWDAEHGLFVDGEPSRRYPGEAMGYMEVGRVTESRAPGVLPGQVVATTYGHRSGHVVDPAHSVVTVLPPDLDPLLGVYVAQMGPICANGLLHAAAELVGTAPADPGAVGLGDGVVGRKVLVTGGGVVGLLTGLFARAGGAAEVALADPDPQRLAAARGLGLTPVEDDRGRAPALATALRSLRPQSTVVDLAFYEGGAPELRLGEEFHHQGLTIRCAQINRVPRGFGAAWDRPRLSAETLTLLAAHGEDVRRHLVTDVVPFDQGPDFITELAERRRSCLQAVFAL